MRLGLLLQLQRRARRAEEAELPFIFVNETRTLLPYRQAVFWKIETDGTWKTAAVSGLAAPDPGAPFVLWLNALAKALRRLPGPAAAGPLDRAMLPANLTEAWGEWLPAAGLQLPLYAGKRLAGVLALFRDEAFRDDEAELLGHLAEAYGQCLASSAPDGALAARFRLPVKSGRLWLAAALACALFFPIRQSVLAPAEVIPLTPAHIRASLDGVVKTLFVAPNQTVSAGDKLVGLEDDKLRTQLIVAQKNLETARAELQQTQQMSLADPRVKMRLPMLLGRVEQLTAEVDYVQSQLDRVVIVSPVDGVAVFDDPDAWPGRPVSLGQKIMEVADPAEVQLGISLPMSETLPLAEGDGILFFPNISPHAPLPGTLVFIGYQASETPEAGLAFTLRAHFTPGESLPRLGLRGTAKLYGERRPVIAHLLRRPILQLRQWAGI